MKARKERISVDALAGQEGLAGVETSKLLVVFVLCIGAGVAVPVFKAMVLPGAMTVALTKLLF